MMWPLVTACAFLGACSSVTSAPGASNAAPVSASWCPAVAGLSDDPSKDLTRIENDARRVRAVMAAHEWEFLRCPGVVGVGVTTSAIITYLESGEPSTDRPFPSVREDDRTFVIHVSIRDEEHMPPKRTLYVDGVRVHFEVTGDVRPL